MKTPLPRRWLLLAALTLLACGQLGPAPTEEAGWTPVETSTAPEAAPTALSSAAATAAVPAEAADAGALRLRAAPAGAACFGSSEGLSCLGAGGGWLRFEESDFPLADSYIYATARCLDGSILAADNDTVYRYDGAAWRAVGGSWDGTSPDDLACDADGAIWVAYFGGVAHYAERWVDSAAEALTSPTDATDLVLAVDVAADGQPWVATAASVATLLDGSWRIFAAGEGFADRLFISDLVVAPSGAVWITHSQGLARWDGTLWQLFAAPSGSGSLTAIAAGPDGHIWAATSANGLYLFHDGAWASFSAADGALPSDRVRDVAVDDQGRAWVATAYGLAVYDGTTWRQYQMHTADLIDNALQTVVVAAGGPPLPEKVASRPGALRGALRDQDGSTPLADRPVEICAAPIVTILIDDAPCAGQDFVRTTRSDDRGDFLFSDLPTGFYALTFEVERGEWGFYAGRFGFAARAFVPAGGEADLGDLVYEPDD